MRIKFLSKLGSLGGKLGLSSCTSKCTRAGQSPWGVGAPGAACQEDISWKLGLWRNYMAVAVGAICAVSQLQNSDSRQTRAARQRQCYRAHVLRGRCVPFPPPPPPPPHTH